MADASAPVHPRRSRQVQSVSSLSCLPRRRTFTTQRFFASDGADLRRIIVRSQGGSPVIRLLPRYHTMAEIRPIQPKISNKSIANDRHGVSCVCFLFLRLPGPDLELQDEKRPRLAGETLPRIERRRRTKESQDPVHRLIPSLLTPRQLTRLSWPLSEPILSPRRTSHT